MTVKFTVKCPSFPDNFKTVPFEQQEHYALLKNNPNRGMAEEVLIRDYEDRMTKTDKLNAERNRLRIEMKKRLNYMGGQLGRTYEEDGNGKPITGTIDGTVIVVCDNTLAEVQKVINDLGLEIMPDKPQYTSNQKAVYETRQRQKEIDGVLQFEADGTTPIMEDYQHELSLQDVDEIFEPTTDGETKLIKSRSITNEYKAKLEATLV